MRYLSALAAFIILTSATSGLAYAQAEGYPEEDNECARAWVIDTLENNQDWLEEDGIDASPSELRLMTNDQDPDACAELGGAYLSTNEAASEKLAVTDTLGVEDIRERIIGTWLEDPKQDGTLPREWVFTEDGTLQQHVNGELDHSVDYEVNAQCEDSSYGTLEASPRQIAMLELTRADGTVSCKYITQWVEDHSERPEYFTLGTEHETILFERK